MKTRVGFVSNSSSSSFVIMIEREEYERALDIVHPYVKAVVEAMETKEGIFAGQDIVAISDWWTAGYSCSEDIEERLDYEGEIPESEWDENMKPHEAYEIFTNELDSNKCFGHGSNF